VISQSTMLSLRGQKKGAPHYESRLSYERQDNQAWGRTLGANDLTEVSESAL
jgi:hypothetical protein